MATGYVLYNNFAGTREDRESVELLKIVLDKPLSFIDITKVRNYRVFFQGMEKDDFVIISGGDGTLNRFINDTEGIRFPCDILYFPNGSGNDFARELGEEKGGIPFSIVKYLQNLPTVTVKGKTYRFLNGVGFGIDGYCCEAGDKLKETSDDPINYTAIAIKGLLGRFKPCNATVTVDGIRHHYKKVWLAPTMHGKYYGGGMLPAPKQKRGSGELSVMVYHNAGPLRALMVFPSIFKGEHMKHNKMVEVLTGKEVSVEFDSYRALQIDGETILNVSGYTAKAEVKEGVLA